MHPGFLAPLTGPPHLASARAHFANAGRSALSRPSPACPTTPCPAPPCTHAPPRPATMLAKYQKQDDSQQQSLDDQSELEKIIPPPALPTLSTLTDAPNLNLDLDALKAPGPVHPDVTDDATDGAEPEPVASMGPGLTPALENSIITFFSGVVEEFNTVEWPAAARVARLTLVIIVSLAVAVLSLYFVDGFFYRMSQIVFEGKV